MKAEPMSNELLPKDWEGKPVPRSLVEDLADVLSRMVVGWKDMTGIDLSEHSDVQRVMARYRLEYDHQQRIERYGLEVERDCTIFGNSLHSRIEGEIERTDPATWMVRVVESPPFQTGNPSVNPSVEHKTIYQCRKCGQPIEGYRFGSAETGWEHMEGECSGPSQV